jgi:2OG-Fe(II) oxygenase superfamily
MNVENPALCISVYHDVFTELQSKTFISKLEEEVSSEWSELKWGSSLVGGGQSSKYRTSLTCSMIPLMKPYPETELSNYFTHNIRNPIEVAAEDYRSQFLVPSGFHEAYQLLKYFPQSEYHTHIDHSRDNARVFSMVSCVQSPESGGELEFPFFNLKIPMKTGIVILFPSNFPYIHTANPVEDGIKYSLVTWYQ